MVTKMLDMSHFTKKKKKKKKEKRQRTRLKYEKKHCSEHPQGHTKNKQHQNHRHINISSKSYQVLEGVGGYFDFTSTKKG